MVDVTWGRGVFGEWVSVVDVNRRVGWISGGWFFAGDVTRGVGTIPTI